jgi:hypothetical protein
LTPIDAPALISLRLVCDPDIDAAQIIFAFLTGSSLPSLRALHVHVDASLVSPLPAAAERNVEAQKTRLTLPRGVAQQLEQVTVKVPQTYDPSRIRELFDEAESQGVLVMVCCTHVTKNRVTDRFAQKQDESSSVANA